MSYGSLLFSLAAFSRSTARPCLAFLIAGGLQMTAVPHAAAEHWKKVADWVLVGSTNLGGCTMATRFSKGAFLSISTVLPGGGNQTWELLVSDKAWGALSAGERYEVDVLMVGSSQGPKRRPMLGFGDYATSSMVSNALYAEFSAPSEFATFLSRGIETSSHIAFYLEGRMLGTYALEEADTAFLELQKCYEAFSKLEV